jgi:hypothetical protein
MMPREYCHLLSLDFQIGSVCKLSLAIDRSCLCILLQPAIPIVIRHLGAQSMVHCHVMLTAQAVMCCVLFWQENLRFVDVRVFDCLP